MKITGTYLGRDSTPWVSVDGLVSRAFNLSRSESRRLLYQGAVTLDGETFERVDAPVSELAGRQIGVERMGVTDLEPPE